MSRIQLALNVDDLTESIAFYSALFGTEPAKVKPGYANFAVAEPPLKLVLIENAGQGGSINHLGVEVPDVDTVDAEQTRLTGVGLASVDERGTTCCYAKQDKFWVEGAPNGERWEIYTVLADSATFSGEPAGNVGNTENAEGATCCASEVGTERSADQVSCC
jgi:catechol 2,3-dioxygenase-like lactoylglutathione lyase family enzyme